MAEHQPTQPYRSLKPAKGAFPLLVTLILWSSAMVAIRYAVQSYEPTSMALLRLLTGSAALSFILLDKRHAPKLSWKEVGLIFLLGFLINTVYQTGLSFGERTVTAGMGSFIISTIPLYTAIGATLLHKEKMMPVGWLGILISLIGTSIIAIGEAEHSSIDHGVLYVMTSSVAASIYILFSKPLIAKLGPIRATAYLLWAGTVFLLVFTPGLFHDLKTAPLSATLSIIYLGIFPTAIGYITYNQALYYLPTTIASQWLFSIPLFTCILAFIFLGEIPTLTSTLGGCVAMIGTIVVTLATPKNVESQ